jgi:membrane fusion protein, multidrug efflux system
MALPGKLLRIGGILVGLVLLVGGILCVIFLAKPQPQAMAVLPVRPVKTMLVGGPVPITQRRYPGKVQAAQRVQLSFDVGGAIEELPVVAGQRVAKGDVLAKLDPRDYQNTYNARKAVEEERRVNSERVREASTKGAATAKELDQALTTYETAKADTAIAQKALEDAVIHAPFSGVIAYTLVRQYQKVAAKEPIMSLQDPALLEIVIHLPEQVMALQAGQKGRTVDASFDFVPGRKFPMTVKEYATEADQATQTYAVTLAMPAPDNATILPGMSATVTVDTPPILGGESQGYPLPLTAVPADGAGKFFVWIVEPADKGLYAVRRSDVTVGPMTKEFVLVTAGVTPKQQVVTAGVHLLETGQRVRLLADDKSGGGP